MFFDLLEDNCLRAKFGVAVHFSLFCMNSSQLWQIPKLMSLVCGIIKLYGVILKNWITNKLKESVHKYELNSCTLQETQNVMSKSPTFP